MRRLTPRVVAGAAAEEGEVEQRARRGEDAHRKVDRRDVRPSHEEERRVPVDGRVALQLRLDPLGVLRHPPEKLQRLLDQVLVVRRREEAQQHRDAVVLAHELLVLCHRGAARRRLLLRHREVPLHLGQRLLLLLQLLQFLLLRI